ncbi:unnamed protein product [Schistosoma margrebowiei]|uniref:Uncharacterized protein n=1 Tax=Schistosoma margrebowiei TaxID=48269 RepID=A0A183N5H5_9TREM|nr:unnamed protein product [Schistosoma margrebowiei]
MVFEGSQQDTLDLCFVLFGTCQQEKILYHTPNLCMKHRPLKHIVKHQFLTDIMNEIDNPNGNIIFNCHHLRDRFHYNITLTNVIITYIATNNNNHNNNNNNKIIIIIAQQQLLLLILAILLPIRLLLLLQLLLLLATIKIQTTTATTTTTITTKTTTTLTTNTTTTTDLEYADDIVLFDEDAGFFMPRFSSFQIYFTVL